MSNVTRRSLAGALGAGAAALAAPRWLRGAASRRPNIIFVLSDDVGIDLIGCYGSDRYKTPNIDALAKAGVRFETCHSTPLCGPTRCEFLTGRYGFRTGGLTNESWDSPRGKGPHSTDEISIARLLKQAGYATCSAGKWRQVPETPGDWGFDEWLTDPKPSAWYWEKSYTRNGQLVELDKEVYCPDVVHEFAMDFVKRHREGPFFLYYPTHLVHAFVQRTPDSAPDSQDLFADNVAYMDKQVGGIVAEIERLGLLENTVILFAGDNGTDHLRWAKRPDPSGTIGGRQLIGGKASMLDSGTRVPLIASWKGTAPAGKVLKDMVDFSDFYATFAELAGAKPPGGVTIDGRSFAPQLRGRKGNPREWIFVQLGSRWYVKEQGWKLNQSGELYDMQDAPFNEKLVPADTKDAHAIAARRRLETTLDRLNPAGGKTEAPPQR